MITLACDCLLFQMASGEQIPYSAEMVCHELAGQATRTMDAEVVDNVAHAVFHYFKRDLGRQTVSETEFSEAMEKVLHGLAYAPAAGAAAPGAADLSRLASQVGEGGELFFFPLLREEVRRQLREAPAVLRFCSLRLCVKHLTGAQRRTDRCRQLEERIVAYLRECLGAEAGSRSIGLIVE